MRKWRLLIHPVLAALILSACGSTDTPPGGGPGLPDPDPDPEPGTCRVVVNDDITVMQTWENSASDCDYLLDGQITLSTQLTIEPGTTIVASSNALLRIADGGRLVAEGSESARISFVGLQGVPGSWYGLCFSGSHLESRLDHVDVFWAGGVWSGESSSCRAGIGGMFDGGGKVHITNSSVVGSYTTGIDATEFTLGDFSGNVLAGHNEYGLRVSPGNMGRLDATSNYSGNGYTMPDGSSAANGSQFVFLDSGRLDKPSEIQYWSALDVPYLVRRDEWPYATSAMFLAENSTVFVNPGTQFVMGEDALLVVEWGAVLALAGEPGKEVRFTGRPQVAGIWEGIWMNGGGLLADHVHMSHGGQADVLIQNAIITFWDTNVPSHCSHLRNVTLTDSATAGVSTDENYQDFVRLEAMSYARNASGDQLGGANGPPVLDGVNCS